MDRPTFNLPFQGAVLAALLLAGAATAQVMPGPMSMAGAPADVVRLSDADASCEQLYAEATWLEKQIAAQPKAPDPMEAARQMQEDMQKAQQRMVNGARAKGLASSLLGMVPGVGGLAAGALSSVASRPGGGAMQDAIDKSMRVQQESMEIGRRTVVMQDRREHLTKLFLERQCKVSQLNREQVAVATSHLEKGSGKDAGQSFAPAPDEVPSPPVEESPPQARHSGSPAALRSGGFDSELAMN
ncbi:MAG: hypothetical protein JSR63_12250 [Proteobacteria bacterium]|nr:hypothetical protein [Pseudomonadota bacterium]